MTLVPEPSRIVGFEATVKRALDLGLVAVAMVVALPLLLLMMLAALLSGHGTGLVTRDFVAEGRRLRLAHFVWPAWAKQAHLSRLPDLYQVILGRMSILGPRPIESDSTESYARVMRFLEKVKPGFIGPWWLVGKGRPEQLEAELAFDLYYLRNYSVWLDAQIFLKVALALLGRSSELSFGPDVAPITGLESGADTGQRGGVAREPASEGSVRG
jgi:lipopolysaccharide/colanic/teichoic acid biosynthesis glycosyltransferase